VASQASQGIGKLARMPLSMLGKRRAANRRARRDEALPEGVPENIPPGAVAADERFADEQELPVREVRSLDTPCACGHTRRDHTGLRMEVDGRCRECDCDKFTEVNAARPDDELLQRMRAMVARVERMQRLAIGLRADWSPAGNGRGSNPPR
jgi:hypothetical protein